MISSSAISTEEFFENSSKNFSLSDNRMNLLRSLADKIASVYYKDKVININYICTHNSRRSQFSQVWTFFAAHYFGLNINAFSGGTEITAFNRNTVKALKNSGFHFSIEEYSHQNPIYKITVAGINKYILGFSKIYDNQINKTPYFAVTTCGHADENCPFISDAIFRSHLPFVDPKIFDNTINQDVSYMNTNKEIAANVFFLLKHVQKKLLL